MALQVIRQPDESAVVFLFRLVNQFGATDLGISYNYLKDGEKMFSHRYKVVELWHREWQLKHPEHWAESILLKAQHRTTLPAEVMIDIDNRFVGRVAFQTIKAKALWAFYTLQGYGHAPVMYFTQSKSYHISLILPELLQLDKDARRHVKQEMIARYGGDTQLASEGCQIALEGSIHHRSGLPKILVMA